MSSRFAGSVVLMQEGVGVSYYQFSTVHPSQPRVQAYSRDVSFDFSIRSSTRGGQTVTLDIFRRTSKALFHHPTVHAPDSTFLS